MTSWLPELELAGDDPTSVSVNAGASPTPVAVRENSRYLVQISKSSSVSLPLNGAVLWRPTATNAAYSFDDNEDVLLTATEVTTTGVEGPAQMSWILRSSPGQFYFQFKNLGSETARIRINRVI